MTNDDLSTLERTIAEQLFTQLQSKFSEDGFAYTAVDSYEIDWCINQAIIDADRHDLPTNGLVYRMRQWVAEMMGFSSWDAVPLFVPQKRAVSWPERLDPTPA